MNAKSYAHASLLLLVVWAVLCAVWNVYGVAQLSTGGQALGPTASILGAGLALVLALLLIVALRKWPSAYRWVTLVPCVLAAMTIWNAFRLDPAQRPSEFWRWAGVVVNGLGVAGSALAFLAARGG